MLPPRERRTLTGNCAIGFHVLAFVFITIAMFTRNWLAAENKAYGTSMDRIGLWVQCFRSLTVKEDYLKETFFTGCRWIFDPFTTDYDKVQAMLQEPFFVCVQIFFTICFVLTMAATALTGILVLCPGEDFEPMVLLGAYSSCFASFFFGFLAVILFGAMGDDRDWMPHWEHNNLSWSFALAVIGVVSEFVAGILYWVESRIQKRKELAMQSHGMLPMEAKV